MSVASRAFTRCSWRTATLVALGCAARGSTVFLGPIVFGSILSLGPVALGQEDPALVAAYAFQEGRGSTAEDSAGVAGQALLEGTQWDDQGRYGRALRFPGAPARARVPYSPSLDLGGSLTLEAWVRPERAGGWQTVILREIPGELAYAIYSSDDEGVPSAWVRVGGVSHAARAAEPLPLGAWSHVALTYDGSAIRLWIDGTIAATTGVGGEPPPSILPLWIGGNPVWGEHFEGRIDEVRVWRHARGAEEIARDLATPVPPASSEPLAVAIVTPAPGATIAGTVGVEALPSDGVAVAGIQFLLDGEELGAEDTVAPYEVAWDTAGTPNGPHALRARERAVSGTTALSEPVEVVVLNVAGTPILVDGGARLQTIDGLGVNVNSGAWADGGLAPALDLLVDEQGASLFRVIVETHAGWEETNDDGDPLTFDDAYYDALYETPKFRGAWGVLGHLRSRGVKVTVNIMGALPSWLGRSEVDDEDEWVELVASFLRHGREKRGIEIDLLSPLNECDIGFPEGPRVPPAQYVRLLRKLLDRLDTLGMSGVRLAGPDTASLDGGVWDYMPAMLADSRVMSRTDRFVLHSYVGYSGTADATIKGSAYSDRGFWLSEWAAVCAGCDSGFQISAEWEFSLNSVKNLLAHLGAGASGAMVYDAFDSYYEHHGSIGYWGQLALAGDGTYSPRKRFWANAQAFRFVPPGSVRLQVTAPAGGPVVLAFHHARSGRVTLLGYNDSARTETLAVALLDLPEAEVFEAYRTTSSVSFQRGADVPVSGGSFTVTVGPSTIFTFTSPGAPAVGRFVRGDSNLDGEVDIADAVSTLLYLFHGLPTECRAALDANDDGAVDVSDAIRLLGVLFLGEVSLAQPYPACGADPDPALPCEGTPVCP